MTLRVMPSTLAALYSTQFNQATEQLCCCWERDTNNDDVHKASIKALLHNGEHGCIHTIQHSAEYSNFKKKINSRAVEQDLSGLNSSHELHQTVYCDPFPDIMKNGNKLSRGPHPSVQLLKYNRKNIYAQFLLS